MIEFTREKTEVVYVKWVDHHWYEDKLTKGEVVERTKGTGAVVEEAGILLLENDEFLVMAHVKNHEVESEPYAITYDGTTRILKSAVVQMQKMEIKD